MADTLNFKKGVASALPAASNGQILFTTDTNELYIDDAGSHKQINANNAKSADKLNTNAGDSNTPVYFSNGKPVVCTGLDLDTSGNAATATSATKATQDGNGNTITSTYLPLSGGTITGSLMVDNGNSSGSVGLFEDGEGGTIILKSKNGTYQYHIDAHDDETIRIHTADLNPNNGYKQVSWNGKTGALTADSFNGNATSATTAASCSGNAATATKLATARTISLTGDVTGSGSFDGSGNLSITATVADNSHNHSYLPLAGGTVTGKISRSNQAGTLGQGWDGCILSAENVSSYTGIYCGNGDAPANALGTSGVANLFIKSWYGVGFVDGCTGKGMTVGIDCRSGTIYSNKTYGAVWNDYAEYRAQKETIEPGYCVASADNGQVYKTTEKFQACDGIVSDTFGFAIGETDECKTPLAVAGRVLAYCAGDRYDYHSGDTVCAGPDGKVVKMTREEIREWPDRIIGIVSEIPEYETWGTGNVAVDGRIWIKIK